jgi:hypothetical protein
MMVVAPGGRSSVLDHNEPLYVNRRSTEEKNNNPVDANGCFASYNLRTN